MTLKQQKIISAGLITLVVFGGFQILAYIVNLNQPAIFIEVAAWVYLYLVIKMAFFYDLHFKNVRYLERAIAKHESVKHRLVRFGRIFFTAFWDRILHIRKWDHFKHFQNYLLLPGIIFWSTVSLLYLNLGRIEVQQIFILLSSMALIITYWYLKEIFRRRKEVVDHDIFVVLSVVKLYSVFVTFSAALGIIRFFGLSQNFFILAIFSLTSLLIYQALFQHGLVRLNNMFVGIFIAFIMMLISSWVFSSWGFNYFTAGGFLMVIYNFLWGLFHHYLDKTLNKRNFFELLILTIIVGIMLVSITNFQEQLIEFS